MDANEFDELEVLMGWDGDRCACTACPCESFVDEPNETWCRDCRAGRHTAGHAVDDRDRPADRGSRRP